MVMARDGQTENGNEAGNDPFLSGEASRARRDDVKQS